MNEITISIKGDESKYSVKELDYVGLRMSVDDPDLKKMVDNALIKFKATTDNINEQDIDIVVKSKLTWKK